MKRNTNGFLKCFINGKAYANDVVVDSKGSIIIDCLNGGDMDKTFMVETTLCCLGNIDVHDIDVGGDLICKGYFNATDVKVTGDFVCEEDANVTKTEVLGNFTCKGNLESNGNLVIVHGDFLCEGNCNADVLVNGDFVCKGKHTGKHITDY